MKDIFNFSRFGKYLVYDLRRAKNNYWLSLLILGLLPVVIFLFYQVFSKLFTGEWGENNIVNQVSAVVIAYITLVISFPNKVYGSLTEKRAGSDFLMLPASGLEKWASMAVVTCVVLPLCAGTLLFGSDALLCAIVPNYGVSIFSKIGDIKPLILDQTDGLISLNIPALMYYEWASTILIFTLGAIFFKKAKAAKTILVLIAISMVTGPISMALFGTTHIGLEDMVDFAETLDEVKAVKILLGLINGTIIATFVLVLGGLYARIKTLKH